MHIRPVVVALFLGALPLVSFAPSVSADDHKPAAPTWERVTDDSGVVVFKQEIAGSSVIAFKGVGSVDAFADIADETWSRVIGVNLTGAFHCARAAVRAMKAKGTKGTVINVSSTAALSGDGPAHYCASKAALMGLTRSMAKELAPLGIRVNTIVPGPTNTPMMQGIPQEWADAIVKGVPMGRMAEPEDIASVALFLASDDAGFVTGQNIAVNGGSAFL